MSNAWDVRVLSRYAVQTAFAALIGTVSGGTVATTFYSLDLFERNRSLSGMAQLIGDVEYRGQGLNKSSGTCYGFVDSSTGPAGNTSDVSPAGPYVWRQ